MSAPALRRVHYMTGRHYGDPAWPGPVWGHSDPAPWSDPATAPLTLAVSKS